MPRSRQPSLGVDWHLPARTGRGYAKRPFASTTPASSSLIEMLAGDGLTWAQVEKQIEFDAEARAVAAGFVAAGHGDTLASSHLNLPVAVGLTAQDAS